MKFNNTADFISFFRSKFEFPKEIQSDEERTRYIARWVVDNAECEALKTDEGVWCRVISGKVIIGSCTFFGPTKLKKMMFMALVNSVAYIVDTMTILNDDIQSDFFAGAHCFSDLNF